MMAKKHYKLPTHQTGTVVTTKTHFGSTSDMIVDHSKYLFEDNTVNLQDNEVVCKDDRGFYVTSKNRIDSGLADPNRYAHQAARLMLQEATEKNDSTS
jgi:hypothetical protein